MFLINKNEISHKIKQFRTIFYSKERLVTQIPLLFLNLQLLNPSLHKNYIFVSKHHIFKDV